MRRSHQSKVARDPIEIHPVMLALRKARARHDPTLSMLETLAKALRVKVGRLLE